MNLLPISALGTQWHIELLESRKDSDHIHITTKTFLDNFETKYSRFKSDSWLSQLNENRTFANPDSEFTDILEKSLEYYQVTNGVFNISIGQRMENSGYDSSYSFIAKDDETLDLPVLSDILEVSKSQINLKNGRLDLGGIGKGFVIDLLVNLYKEMFGLKYFIINGGGDIFVTSDNGVPVDISLTHPQNQTMGIGSVDLFNQGFAASSPYLRAWQDKKTDTQHNHLHTSNNVASYIVANTCCDADVWATTCAIKPETKTPPDVRKLLLENSKIIENASIFKLNTTDVKNKI